MFKNLTKRFIFFLVRTRLGLGLWEAFRFVGQKSNAIYFFTEDAVMKEWHGSHKGDFTQEKSGVSLNWLLDDECKIEKVQEEELW